MNLQTANLISTLKNGNFSHFESKNGVKTNKIKFIMDSYGPGDSWEDTFCFVEVTNTGDLVCYPVDKNTERYFNEFNWKPKFDSMLNDLLLNALATKKGIDSGVSFKNLNWEILCEDNVYILLFKNVHGVNKQLNYCTNNYQTIENIKLDRKYLSFVSALKVAKVRIIREEAFLKLKQISSTLEGVVFKFKINEDFTFTVEQTEGEVCSKEQITRIVKDIDSLGYNPYAEKYIIGDLEFTDSNGDLCYLEVEQLRPIDKLRSILDDLETEPSLEVFKDVKDSAKVNRLIDSLFFDEEVSRNITNQGMKLTTELKENIENYFNTIDPDELVDNLVDNFGFEEVKEETTNSYLLDSFNKIKEEQKKELQKRIDEKEKELIKLSDELNTTNSKIKKTEEDLSNLNARLSSFEDIELENGYSFAISKAINTPIDISETDEELLKKVASNFQIPYDKFKKYVTESSFKIYIKNIKEDLDITKAYEKIYLIDPNAIFELIENNVLLYKGKLKWHDLVDSMIRKGFKQDPELDKEIEELDKVMEIQEN